MGDETQDADGGGLGLDWVDDWFADFDDGDELDEDFTEDFGAGRAQAPRTLGAARRPAPARRPRHRAAARPEGRAA